MLNANEIIHPIVEWDMVHPLLTKLGFECEQGEVSNPLIQLAHLYGFHTYDISTYGIINDERFIGVIVTHEDIELDNGIYIFHSSQAGRIVLSVVQPSTIDRQAIVNRTVLNIETSLSGTDIPTLTPDDIVRTVYELLKRQVCDANAKNQQLPEDKFDEYSKIYMDLLLHNLYMYHTQDNAYQESVINDQPNRIRTLLLKSDEAEQITKQVINDVDTISKTHDGASPC